jgi:hypothetical protein
VSDDESGDEELSPEELTPSSTVAAGDEGGESGAGAKARGRRDERVGALGPEPTELTRLGSVEVTGGAASRTSDSVG